mgnify:CR=1 FL=1
MTNFIQFANRIAQLDKVANEDLLTKLKTKTIEKGSYLLKRGEVCSQIFFIDKGLAKTFFNKEDKEFIMRFFPENSMFTVLDSYIQQTPSTFMILALEPMTITYINRADL